MTGSDLKTKKCLTCDADISGYHANKKRCDPCAIKLLKKPQHNLTNEQQTFVLNNYKKMKRHELAEGCGASRANVNRFMREYGLKRKHNKWENDKKTVKAVLKCYYDHGRQEAIKRFKNVSVRSIVERYRLDDCGNVEYAPDVSLGVHCKQWTDREALFVLRYKDILIQKDISEFLDRNNAVRNYLKRNYKGNGKKLSTFGLPHRLIKHHVSSDAPIYKKPVNNGLRMVSWVDIAEFYTHDDVNIYKLAKSMARFVYWLHGGLPLTDKQRIFDYEREFGLD